MRVMFDKPALIDRAALGIAKAGVAHATDLAGPVARVFESGWDAGVYGRRLRRYSDNWQMLALEAGCSVRGCCCVDISWLGRGEG